MRIAKLRWERLEDEVVAAATSTNWRSRIDSRFRDFAEAVRAAYGDGDFVKRAIARRKPTDPDPALLATLCDSLISAARDRAESLIDMNAAAIVGDDSKLESAHKRYVDSGERLRSRLNAIGEYFEKHSWFDLFLFYRAMSPPAQADIFSALLNHAEPDPDSPEVARIGWVPVVSKSRFQAGDVVVAITFGGVRRPVKTWSDFVNAYVDTDAEEGEAEVSRRGQIIRIKVLARGAVPHNELEQCRQGAKHPGGMYGAPRPGSSGSALSSFHDGFSSCEKLFALPIHAGNFDNSDVRVPGPLSPFSDDEPCNINLISGLYNDRTAADPLE